MSKLDAKLSEFCLSLKRDESMSVDEIAKACGVNRSSIYWLEQRALQKLRGMMGDKLKEFY